MTNLKSTYGPGEEFQLVLSAHDILMAQYGTQRISNWFPTKENVLILSNEEYVPRYKQLHRFDEQDEAQRMQIERDLETNIAYAHFPTGTMMIREETSAGKSLVLQESSAHEELHLWSMRDRIDPEDHSWYVNEQFIDYLALRALGLMEMPFSDVPEELHNHIANAMYIHEVLDSLGEDSDKLLFDVCQGYSQETLRERLNSFYGQGPSSNELMQVLHGTDFYSRFKDLAVITYMTGLDSDLQNKPAVQACGMMILEWISMRKEIKHLSRPDLI